MTSTSKILDMFQVLSSKNARLKQTTRLVYAVVVYIFLVAFELEGNIFHWKKPGEGESKPDIFVDKTLISEKERENLRLIENSYFNLYQNYPF